MLDRIFPDAAHFGDRAPVSHSHIALQHLITQLDAAAPSPKRPPGPHWLPEFVDQVAELFEPFVDVGRVGYECAPNAERWEIAMYLGSTEVMGGKVDGEVRPVAFQFDLARLETIFDRVDECRWSAFPAGTIDDESQTHAGERSFITVVGRYRDHVLRLRVFGAPPPEVAPGLRQY
ncbi:MAG TPA: hypothetical protein VKU82_04530, partial [Planctomycetaceae bacterium]|nr:hypothetical protein [Planctomycetaceae bacterium]